VSLANFVIGFETYKQTGDLPASLTEIQDKVAALLQSGQMAKRIRNWDTYATNGEVIATHVLQHATLSQDLANFASDLQLAHLAIAAPDQGGHAESRYCRIRDFNSAATH